MNNEEFVNTTLQNVLDKDSLTISQERCDLYIKNKIWHFEYYNVGRALSIPSINSLIVDSENRDVESGD